MPALQVRGLVAGYGGVAVVHGVDLTVGAGEVVALLGANGAGKTTTLLALTGMADRLSGTVEVDGSRIACSRTCESGGCAGSCGRASPTCPRVGRCSRR